MLLGLVILLAGALLLQAHAASRGNDPLVVAIHDEPAAAEDDEGEGAVVAGAFEGPPVSDRHARARRAARRALFAEALPLYEQALAATPGSAALEGELGYWLAVAGQPERALPHLERADRAAPTADSALRLGLARARLGDRRGAEADVRRALELRPNHGPAQVALGSLLRRRGAHEEAIAVLERAASAGANEERARALAALGRAQLAAGRRPDAARSFERAIEFAPARVEIRLAIARAYLAADGPGDVARAVSVLRRAAELAPDQAAVQFALGRAHERLGDPSLAFESYDRAVRLDPGLRLARRRLLRLALQDQDFARARLEAERLVADGPDVPEHHFLAALAAERDGRRDDARRAYRTAIEVAKGDYPEAWLNLGLLEKNAGNLAAAERAYRKAIELRPGYNAAWFNLAKLQEAAGRPSQAEATYRRALAVDPRYASAWLALGQLRSELGRTGEAIHALTRASQLRPGYTAAELSLGVAYARAGRHEEAVQTYRSLLEQEPRYVSAWYNLALAQQALGRNAKARDALARALAVDPEHVPSRRALAAADLAAGRLDEARAGYEEALDHAPGDLSVRVALAQIAALSGDRGECERRARTLRAEAPGDPRVQTLSTSCAAAPPKQTSKTEVNAP
jgi:tetratricopeptide (TPR) repeat protein